LEGDELEWLEEAIADRPEPTILLMSDSAGAKVQRKVAQLGSQQLRSRLSVVRVNTVVEAVQVALEG
jgi:hypothetical protein